MSEMVALAAIAGEQVSLDEDELRGALRRAVLLLAAGGDPSRGLELDGRAVTALAADIAAPERAAELRAALAGLRAQRPDEAGRLLADPDLAWRAFACALLAQALDVS